MVVDKERMWSLGQKEKSGKKETPLAFQPDKAFPTTPTSTHTHPTSKHYSTAEDSKERQLVRRSGRKKEAKLTLLDCPDNLVHGVIFVGCEFKRKGEKQKKNGNKRMKNERLRDNHYGVHMQKEHEVHGCVRKQLYYDLAVQSCRPLFTHFGRPPENHARKIRVLFSFSLFGVSAVLYFTVYPENKAACQLVVIIWNASVNVYSPTLKLTQGKKERPAKERHTKMTNLVLLQLKISWEPVVACGFIAEEERERRKEGCRKEDREGRDNKVRGKKAGDHFLVSVTSEALGALDFLNEIVERFGEGLENNQRRTNQTFCAPGNIAYIR